MTNDAKQGHGRVLSARVVRPGRAKLIAANGWHCAHSGCKAPVTVEVAFTKSARSVGFVTGCHGTCEAHAKAHAAALRRSGKLSVAGSVQAATPTAHSGRTADAIQASHAEPRTAGVA